MGRRIEYAYLQRMGDSRLRFIEEVERRKPKLRRAKFLCDCGNHIERDLCLVTSGVTSSCGCYKSELVTEKNTTHGQAVRNEQTGSYRSWQAMHQRVKSDPHYAHVSICERWNNFENFYEDMGDRPVNGTIERIHNLGNYEPNNCKWAGRLEQGNNTSLVTPVEINGQTKSIREWCREYGISYARVKQRRSKGGWDLIKAITTPIDTSKRNNRGK